MTEASPLGVNPKTQRETGNLLNASRKLSRNLWVFQASDPEECLDPDQGLVFGGSAEEDYPPA